MKQKRRSIGFILTILCTFTLLLAACRTGASSDRHTMTQNTTRLNLRETPGVIGSMTPGTLTPGTTANTPAEYVGQVQTENAWIGLSSTGKRMVAFVTDGSQGHQPTFAQWFRGAATNGTVDTTATSKAGSDRLQAMLTNNTATGTVTLASGKSLAFTANAVPTSDQTAGLYRSEHEVNNQRYVAGWVVLPAGTTGTATPGTTGTATPSTGNGTVLPPIGSLTPSATGTTTPSATETITPSTTGTATPSATGTTTPSATGTLQQGGALLNEQNNTVLPVPQLTQDQINSKQITVPNMANFKLVPCQQNLC